MGRRSFVSRWPGARRGLIAIADAPRPTSKQAVAALSKAGIEVVMLTGDNEATARRVAGELSISTVVAEVLPGDKASRVAELQADGRRGGYGRRRRQ